jgi:hypothetical protein
MTALHRKSNDHSHSHLQLFLVDGLSNHSRDKTRNGFWYNEFSLCCATVAQARVYSTASLHRAVGKTSHQHQQRDDNRQHGEREAGQRHFDFQFFAALRRGVKAWANHNRGRHRRQSQSREHMFPTVHQIPGSPSRPALYGRARPLPNSRTAPRSANVWRNTGCPASASRRSMSAWSSSRKSGRAAALEIQFADACQPAPGSRAWGNCGHTAFAFGHRDQLRVNASAIRSGDGLGNHQPGSMTCGFAIARQPASGRARDRARCPAVARSFLRRPS